ncbi:MAG: HEAT repeat domain-containing protein [Proteobacteria bacterium]|nr:HEAT repeat domain-containing protein [Pseudomonadota bacterium]
MANKSGFHIELIPNMYELGFFKKTLQSSKRLRITTLWAILILTAAFGCAGFYIHDFSTSSTVNSLLIVALYINAIVVGYLCALTIGDLVFHGPWREKMAKGAKFIPEDVEDQKALLKNRNIYFILIWVVSIVALIFGCDFCTGGGVRWYHNVGGVIVSMRSPDAAERALVIKTISNPYYAKKWEDEDVKNRIVELVLDDDAQVRANASYLAGRAKYVEAADNLMTVLRDNDNSDVVRREAAIALGRLEWKPSLALLLSVMRDSFSKSHGNEELVPAALYAFYSMKESMAARDAMQIIETCVTAGDCSSPVLQYAFFYLKSLHVKDAAPMSLKILEMPEISHEMRCYAADILRFTASKAEVPRMKQAFDKVNSNDNCPIVYRKYHEEAAIILFEDDYMRSLFVRSVGNIMDSNDYDWIWSIGSNTSENMQTRKVAEMYTRAMRQKGIVK